jgi:predicted nucleotidyltransferase
MDEIVERGTILRGVVGSTAHGLALAGMDDRDEMGVCINPPETVVGLSRFEQYIYRDAEQRTPVKNGVMPRSQPGELDLTIYSLQKYVKLSVKGNPSILLLLWLPNYEKKTYLGQRLIDMKHLFVSKQAGKAFLGYLTAQKERLLGMRGQMRVTRPELVEEHGYDTKYAAHAYRLGLQGIEYLSWGRITLPLPGLAKANCLAIRTGGWDFNKTLTEIGVLQEALETLLEEPSLYPDVPDHDTINRHLVTLYQLGWAEMDFLPEANLDEVSQTL